MFDIFKSILGGKEPEAVDPKASAREALSAAVEGVHEWYWDRVHPDPTGDWRKTFAEKCPTDPIVKAAERDAASVLDAKERKDIIDATISKLVGPEANGF